MKIAIDFDGTCVLNMYPQVGDAVPFVFEVLNKIVKEGHELILLTQRSHKEINHSTEKSTLSEAIEWFQEHKIELFGINNNREQTWSNSPKVYADLYIDDRSLGIPLIYGEEKPYIDWLEVDRLLVRRGIYKQLLTENI